MLRASWFLAVVAAICGASLAQAADDEKPRELVMPAMPTAKGPKGVEARVPKLDLDQPLQNALEDLARQGKLKIQPNWVELTTAGIERTRRVGQLTLSNVSVQTALDVVCRLAGPVGWTEVDDLVVVTSQAKLSALPVTREYHAGPLKAAEVPALVRTLLDVQEIAAADKGERIAVTARLADQPDIERVLTLAWRGTSAEEWMHILSGPRFRVSREADFGWDQASLQQVLADLSTRGGTIVILDEPALLEANISLQPVSIKSERMTPDRALAVVLALPANAALALDSLGRGEVLLVTTRQRVRPLLASFTVLRPLLAKKQVETPQALMALIAKTVEAPSWRQEQPAPGAAQARPAPAGTAAGAAPRPAEGRMAMAGNRLICRQSAKNLEAIGNLVEDPLCRAISKRLSAIAAAGKGGAPRTPSGQPTPAPRQPTVPPVRPPITPPVRPPVSPGKGPAAGAKTEPPPRAPVEPAEEPQTRRFQLAEAYLRQGLNDKAAEIFHEIIEKYPQSPEAAKSRQKLDEMKPE